MVFRLLGNPLALTVGLGLSIHSNKIHKSDEVPLPRIGSKKTVAFVLDLL